MFGCLTHANYTDTFLTVSVRYHQQSSKKRHSYCDVALFVIGMLFINH